MSDVPNITPAHGWYAMSQSPDKTKMVFTNLCAWAIDPQGKMEGLIQNVLDAPSATLVSASSIPGFVRYIHHDAIQSESQSHPGHDKGTTSGAGQLRTSAIDLEEFRATKGFTFVVRMLRAFNNLALSPYIAARIETAAAPDVEAVSHGVQWALFRSRLAVAARAMKEVIEPLRQPSSSDVQAVLDNLRGDAELSRRWMDLNRYLEEGEQSEIIKHLLHFDPANSVRNLDEDSIREAFDRLLAHRDKDPVSNRKIGFHVRGDFGLTRYLFLDENDNLAWYAEHGIPIREDGVDEEALNVVSERIGDFMSSVAEFINSLTIHFFESQNLIVKSFDPPEWTKEPTSVDQDIFELFRDGEEQNFQAMRAMLGESWSLMNDLLALYKTFLRLIQPCVVFLNDSNQVGSIMHCVQWLRNEAISGNLTLLRGHISDSMVYTRKAIEICAFIVQLFENTDSAQIWMEMGRSDEAREKYVKEFAAFKLVKKKVTPELVGLYETHCLSVHPSLSAVSSRASFGENLRHRFRFFDLSQDGDHSYFIMEYMMLIYCHLRIMEFLTTIFYKTDRFDSKTWLETYLPIVEKWKAIRQLYVPMIDEHFAQMENDSGEPGQ